MKKLFLFLLFFSVPNALPTHHGAAFNYSKYNEQRIRTDYAIAKCTAYTFLSMATAASLAFYFYYRSITM